MGGLTKGEAAGRVSEQAVGGSLITMPRVVPDQRSKFENEEFFRKLSRECEVKYTGFRDRPHEERQARFQNACRDGRSEIAFVATGTNLSLQFFPASWQGEQRQTPTREYVDFEREGGKVYLKAPMILNGVCVIWKGWIDLQRLDGMGCLEFDEERAQEDALAQQAFEEARRRTREFEDRDRSHREEMEVRASQLISVTDFVAGCVFCPVVVYFLKNICSVFSGLYFVLVFYLNYFQEVHSSSKRIQMFTV
ncbi:core-binding factor subunit beta-like isoform X2 [Lathamus discolor]|uniref:core-binding factor subunit beta-like isoform X2 n=1 Tax=Lathamus discolor TaxID=678569 RepID=UPI0032B82EB8